MPTDHDLIDQLIAELEPRRGVSPWIGRALIAASALLTVVVLVAARGMRADYAGGSPHSVSLLSALVVLCAGAVTAAAVTAMARPAVGAARSGWQGAVAALAVLPAAALVTELGGAAPSAASAEGIVCLAIGVAASIASIAVLALWLRRGAPTSAARASWLIGITGGAAGALAMALVCPLDSIMHIGIWHAGIIAVAAVAARLVLPRFLRW